MGMWKSNGGLDGRARVSRAREGLTKEELEEEEGAEEVGRAGSLVPPPRPRKNINCPESCDCEVSQTYFKV